MHFSPCLSWVRFTASALASPPPGNPTGNPQQAPHTPPVVADTSGLGDFTWAQVAPLIAALIAAAGVALTLLVNAARARRETLTTLYGDALGAVAEYLEGPYRILRKDGEASTRFAITSKLSDVKTAIDHHQALLRLHAEPLVADAYDLYVSTAKAEAGRQMHDAWNAPAVTTDAGVNLNVALAREESNAKRDLVVEMMQAHLRRRWYKRETRDRYTKAASAVREAHRQAELERQAPQRPQRGKST